MSKVIIISTRKPSNAGGAEIVWENLRKQGGEFENISLDDPDIPGIYRIVPNILHLKEILTSRWLLRKALEGNPKLIVYDKIFGWPKTKERVRKICYNHGSYTIAGLTFKKKNIFIYLFYKYILSYFERESYRNADIIIAVSDEVKNELIRYFGISGGKIIVIDNGIDLNKFRPIKNKKILRNKYGLPLDKKIIFFPGRASFGKGFDIVEDVLEKLGDNYFLFVLGEGKTRVKNIKFIGKVSNEKMPEIYNCADLCLFPSRYEGNSLSVMESAACGVPVLLSRVGVMKTELKMKEYVCDNVEEYVRKIKKLNFGESSKKWRNFSKGYSLKKQVLKLKDLFNNEEFK